MNIKANLLDEKINFVDITKKQIKNFQEIIFSTQIL